VSLRIVTHVPPDHPRQGQIEEAVRSSVASLRLHPEARMDLVLGDAPDYPSFVPAEWGVSIRVVAGNCLRAGRISPEASPRDIDVLVRQLLS
jgi:hypothetical protein